MSRPWPCLIRSVRLDEQVRKADAVYGIGGSAKRLLQRRRAPRCIARQGFCPCPRIAIPDREIERRFWVSKAIITGLARAERASPPEVRQLFDLESNGSLERLQR